MKENNYAFIDSQNLKYGTSHDIYNKKKELIYRGWELDYIKFRKYLSDKFRVIKAIIFIGYIEKYESLYKALGNYGFELVFKPTVIGPNGEPKGNIDAELVLHAAKIEFNNYDKAIVVSSDGDFACLYEELEKERKLKNIIIPNAKNESSLLKKFQQYKIYLEFEKNKLERVKTKSGRRRS